MRLQPFCEGWVGGKPSNNRVLRFKHVVPPIKRLELLRRDADRPVLVRRTAANDGEGEAPADVLSGKHVVALAWPIVLRRHFIHNAFDRHVHFGPLVAVEYREIFFGEGSGLDWSGFPNL